MPEERKTDTPETDAATIELHGKRLATGGWWVEAEFARKLERQRDEALASLATERELRQCEEANVRNLMHYATTQEGDAVLSGYAILVRDAILEKTERLRRLANAASLLWGEHKRYSIETHGVVGCDAKGNDSEAHDLMETLVKETLAGITSKGGEK
jgi:hypothetical protein